MMLWVIKSFNVFNHNKSLLIILVCLCVNTVLWVVSLKWGHEKSGFDMDLS